LTSSAPLTLGVVASSRKPDERRLAIHPKHFSRIAPALRARMFLEHGYGDAFDMPDDRLAGEVAGLRSRDELMASCDVILLPKPLPDDLRQLREGVVLWGWPHCVQDEALTQVAIDRRQTVIAFEAMHHYTHDGNFSLHVFHKNNELAGYCSVLHALTLRGMTGAFGPRLSAAVISFGATGRGAVTALFALGVHEVTVLTHRSVAAVAAPMAPARLVHYDRDPVQPHRARVTAGNVDRPIGEYLSEFDIVVNCIFQDTDDPLMFVTRDELPLYGPGRLFVDVSCDEGMGFEWARPTSFAEPMFTVGDGVHYYAVDHTPSLLFDSATWEISEALISFLEPVMSGPDGWAASPTIAQAIEIRDGVIQNPKILSFQSRAADYPHALLGTLDAQPS
jgi:alanine dehydrogenase